VGGAGGGCLVNKAAQIIIIKCSESGFVTAEVRRFRPRKLIGAEVGCHNAENMSWLV
jgi:hypothetical protein